MGCGEHILSHSPFLIPFEFELERERDRKAVTVNSRSARDEVVKIVKIVKMITI